MATAIPNLWPDDIALDVLPPLAVLRTQAGLLNRITKGLLEADVTTASNEGGNVQHQLELIAPALRGYRHRLLTATHDQQLLYPVSVDAECFRREHLKGSHCATPSDAEWALENYEPPEAVTQQEFMKLVGDALRSTEIRAVIQSLIARSNEARVASPVPGDKGTEKTDA